MKLTNETIKPKTEIIRIGLINMLVIPAIASDTIFESG